MVGMLTSGAPLHLLHNPRRDSRLLLECFSAKRLTYVLKTLERLDSLLLLVAVFGIPNLDISSSGLPSMANSAETLRMVGVDLNAWTYSFLLV